MDCEELKSSVLHWFDSELECRPSEGGSVVATFPVLRVNGDAIDIGISPAGNGRSRLSDMGETHETFFLADLDFHDEYERAAEFKQIITAHELTDVDKEISIEVPNEELTDRIFDFLHALQSISGLQYTAKPRKVERQFNLIVAMFFAEQHAAITIPTEPVQGIGGSWKFDFALNHTNETLIKTISVTDYAMGPSERAIFEINDVKNLRPETLGVTIVDDYKERATLWTPDMRRLFAEYKVPVYEFEANNDALVEFAQKHQVTGI